MNLNTLHNIQHEPNLSLRAVTHELLATSRGPTSTLIGTPFISQKLYLHPGVLSSLESTLGNHKMSKESVKRVSNASLYYR